MRRMLRRADTPSDQAPTRPAGLSGAQRAHGSLPTVTERALQADWNSLSAELSSQGNARLEGLLTQEECESLAALYQCDDSFRSRVVMSRHGFGRGEYRYFRYPLPPLVATLRAALYSQLAALANAWNQQQGSTVRFPLEHEEFLARCHRSGQLQPTPLLLH